MVKRGKNCTLDQLAACLLEACFTQQARTEEQKVYRRVPHAYVVLYLLHQIHKR